MKRLAGALAFLGVTMTAAAAMGQEIQIRGPLANAQSCRRCVQYRAGRISIAPTFGLSLQDEYDRTLWVGAQVNYHFSDLIAIGAWGGFAAAHLPTSLTNAIRRTIGSGGNAATTDETLNQWAADPNPRSETLATRTPNIPRGERFNQQIGQMNWFISVPQLTLIPLRGKIALFQNIFIDTDFYIFAGLAIVGVTERANYDVNHGRTAGDPIAPVAYDNADGLYANQIARSSRIAFTGTFGVGLNFYITHFLSLAVEYRAFPFAWNTSGFDENTTASSCGAGGLSVDPPTAATSCSGHPDYQVDRDIRGNQDRGGRFIIDSVDQVFHFNQMVNFSLSIFLPTAPRRGE